MKLTFKGHIFITIVNFVGLSQTGPQLGVGNQNNREKESERKENPNSRWLMSKENQNNFYCLYKANLKSSGERKGGEILIKLWKGRITC